MNTSAVLPFLRLFLLITSTIAAAAAGNVINDYFDRSSDAIDKPEKAAIVESIGPNKIKIVYLLCLLIAFGSAGLFDILLSAYWLTIYQLVVSAFLFFYSYKLKKWPLVGNMTVALLCAVSLAIVVFAVDVCTGSTCVTGNEFWFYVSFAFLVTLFREIVKDIEDMEGDRVAGCQTIPILFGKKTAVWLATLPMLLTLILLLALTASPNAAVIATLLFTAFLAIQFRLFRADEKTDFQRISQLTKWLMLPALLLLF